MAWDGIPAKECADCGDGAVNHKLVYTSLFIDELFSPFGAPLRLFRPLGFWLHGIEEFVSPFFFKAFVALGLAKKVTEPDEHTMLLALVLWEEAKKRGIDMWEFRLFNLPRNLFVARYPNGKEVAFEGIPEPRGGNKKVWWMDNKRMLKKHFSKLGFPIASGGSASVLPYALDVFARITPPVIVKPALGSGSRHTILHIQTKEQLERAFTIANQVSPFVVIEEELVGPVYRATVVNGRLEATLRRDPPHVVGDGVSTISELIEKANENPKRGGPYYSKLGLNEKAQEELSYQGLTESSVVPEGKKAYLHQKVNWSVGGTTADVTDDVHEDNKVLFEEVCSALNAPITGIDFIIEDISRSWKEQERCGILECNSMPFFDNHHLPFEGTPRNVAAAIWDMVEPISKK